MIRHLLQGLALACEFALVMGIIGVFLLTINVVLHPTSESYQQPIEMHYARGSR